MLHLQTYGGKINMTTFSDTEVVSSTETLEKMTENLKKVEQLSERLGRVRHNARSRGAAGQPSRLPAQHRRDGVIHRGFDHPVAGLPMLLAIRDTSKHHLNLVSCLLSYTCQLT